ncbi:predicted protein [Nematostella vectensis]|uniref:G-protein coupled receptors family 1 profile domain-containing protein n=1 Tax=Nematostella vectensis TaxID=45351 RepID=A7S1I8_NEMVE|nr:predicted protein [Nematostella vectensis]|eukprot:XP_001634576.1 predicted protein [Nematostella vectensis]
MSQANSLNATLGRVDNVTKGNTSVPPPPGELSTSERAQVGGYVTIMVIGVTLNLMVILLVVFRKVPRKNMTLFVVNMAVADLLSLSLEPTHMIYTIISRSYKWIGGDTVSIGLCKAFSLLINSLTWVSLLTLLIISLERFKAVSSTVHLSSLSRCGLASLIAVSWVVSFGLNAVALVKCAVQEMGEYYMCDCGQAIDSSIIFLVTNGVYLILVISILSINLEIVRRLVHSQAAIDLPAAQQERRQKKFRSAVRMVLSSLLIYTLCVSPLYIFLSIYRVQYLLNIVILESNLSAVSVYLFFFAFHANSAIGPVVYFIFLDDFRIGLRSVLSGSPEHNKRRESTQQSNISTSTRQTVTASSQEAIDRENSLGDNNTRQNITGNSNKAIDLGKNLDSITMRGEEEITGNTNIAMEPDEREHSLDNTSL